MADVFKMPKLGESVTTGTVTRWLMAVGDTVDFDDPLLEVSTDKVDSEIPSPFSGVLLEILVPEGETVDVGTELARIGAARSRGAVRCPVRCLARSGRRLRPQLPLRPRLSFRRPSRRRGPGRERRRSRCCRRSSGS